MSTNRNLEKPSIRLVEKPPYGFLDEDQVTLSDDQKIKLDIEIIHARRKDSAYLKEHPEIRAIIREILQAVFKTMPNDWKSSLREIFEQPREILQGKIYPRFRHGSGKYSKFQLNKKYGNIGKSKNDLDLSKSKFSQDLFFRDSELNTGSENTLEKVDCECIIQTIPLN